MSDGTRIAVDLYLPVDRGRERLPSILQQNRYWRSYRLRGPLDAFELRQHELATDFVHHGYAYVSADVRGSGASFGRWHHPWSQREVRDAAELVAWIARQPWSNGRVGAQGVSYNGTAAELLAAQHPAGLRAVAPRSSLFDAYADFGFPGGVPLAPILARWSADAAKIDRGVVPSMAGLLPRLLVRGVRPVDGEESLRAALAEHAENGSIAQVMRQGTFRDDRVAGVSAAAMSPRTYRRQLVEAGLPLYGWSGWFDGALSLAAVRRYRSVRTPGSQLLLGPWGHNTRFCASPTRPGPSRFDARGELLRFFEPKLRPSQSPPLPQAPVHYFTLVEDRWKAADDWPPRARSRRFYLGPGHRLTRDPPEGSGDADSYRVDPSAGTGPESRWDTVLSEVAVRYGDRAAADRRLLTYTSPPLVEPMEVTGHPRVRLYVRSSATDGAFFAYLEDVAPDGHVTYVTEGMLRALHRKVAPAVGPLAGVIPLHSYRRKDAQPLVPGEVAELRFALLPTSVLFRKGHAVRLALAGADRDHFSPIPGAEAPLWEVQRRPAYPSALVLPVVERASPQRGSKR